MTPFELMYGVKARLPAELELTLDATLQDIPEDSGVEQQQRILHIAERVSGLRATALDNISKAQSKQKHQYDVKYKGHMYKVGWTEYINFQFRYLILHTFI